MFLLPNQPNKAHHYQGLARKEPKQKLSPFSGRFPSQNIAKMMFFL